MFSFLLASLVLFSNCFLRYHDLVDHSIHLAVQCIII